MTPTLIPAKLESLSLFYTLPNPAANLFPYVTSLLLLCVTLYSWSKPTVQINKQFPLANKTPWFDFGGTRARNDFYLNGQKILMHAVERHGKKPFRLFTDIEDTTVLPPHYADELRNDDRLSPDGPRRRANISHLRGFKEFSGEVETHMVVDVVKEDLTRNLSKVINPVSDETDYALRLLFTDRTEWHEMRLKDTVAEFVARVSSRVFVGRELCRDPAWLGLTTRFAVTVIQASSIVRLFPYFLRPLANLLLPVCKEMRADMRKAREFIEPILIERRALRAKSTAEGSSGKEGNFTIRVDGLEWFERVSLRDERPYRAELAQMVLAAGSIHTSSDTITQVMFDLAEHPEIFEPLRQEIISVLSTGGWKKTNLNKLILLDSCIRETQRLKPFLTVAMRREVLDEITLSDGTHLRKGSQIVVSLSNWDPAVYTDPAKWDGWRFFHLRQKPGYESRSQVVETSTDNLIFGHGQRACPGRFFAANETKIVLAHLIMKYEWKFVGSKKPQVQTIGFSMLADSRAKVYIRRREEELDLSALGDA